MKNSAAEASAPIDHERAEQLFLIARVVGDGAENRRQHRDDRQRDGGGRGEPLVASAGGRSAAATAVK